MRTEAGKRRKRGGVSKTTAETQRTQRTQSGETGGSEGARGDPKLLGVMPIQVFYVILVELIHFRSHITDFLIHLRKPLIHF